MLIKLVLKGIFAELFWQTFLERLTAVYPEVLWTVMLS